MIVTIERILPGGVGLAHADGKTIFVSLAAKGDRVRINIDREQGNLLFASITEIIDPSPERIEPPCPYFGACGGCDFQQLTYEAQLNAKAEIIRDCLHRIAKIEIDEVPVVASPEIWNYRSRATWQIDPEQHAIGYYERGSRRVCDIAECAVLVPRLQETFQKVRDADPTKFPADLKHLDAVVGSNGVSLHPEFADFHTNEMSLILENETYNFNAGTFFQVNQSLLRHVLNFALRDLTGEVALDLYCGVGLFTLPLARRFKRVVGVEANAKATRFAQRNLNEANLYNAKIVTATVAEWIQATNRSRSSSRADLDGLSLVLLDPPRAGAENVVINGIVAFKPERICYVSCDPATLARDLKKLLAGGYKVEAVSGFDMFPQTHHVETIVHLIRLE